MGPVALTLLLLSALVGFGVNAWRKLAIVVQARTGDALGSAGGTFARGAG